MWYPYHRLFGYKKGWSADNATTRLNAENTLNERSQTQTAANCVILFIWDVQNNSIETLSQLIFARGWCKGRNRRWLVMGSEFIFRVNILKTTFKGWVSCELYLLVAQMVKNLPAMQETQVWSLGWEDPLEKGMATPSSVLAWEIPWTEHPVRPQSMGSQSRTWLSD